MQRVADHHLGDLRHQAMGVDENRVPECRAAGQQGREPRGIYLRCMPLTMHHGVHGRHHRASCYRQSDHSFRAHMAEVNNLTRRGFGSESDEAPVWKVDVGHSLARFAQDGPHEKVDVLRARFEAAALCRR